MRFVSHYSLNILKKYIHFYLILIGYSKNPLKPHYPINLRLQIEWSANMLDLLWEFRQIIVIQLSCKADLQYSKIKLVLIMF